ncbi:MAG: redoxin domain-containing protein, partial [Lachnospiraceae bacterium]|nr:redoxin domain-containing protein [Lachnospiraceae bacterium]
MRKVIIGILTAIIAVIGIVFAGAPVKSSAAAKLSAPVITNKISTVDSVTIEWKEVKGADGYIIYQYSSKTKKYKSCGTISSGSAAGYEITGLKSEKTYKFKVAAYVLKSGKKSVQKKSKVIKIKTLAEETEPVSFSAEDFYVYDEKGNTVNLSDYAGKPIIVNIWATWCGPCVKELPHFEKFYKEYGSKIQFLMVNCEYSDDVEYIKQFINEYGYTFPVYYDFDDSADRAYGTGYIPVTVAISKKGEVIYHDSGSLDEASLKRLIEE